MTSRTMPLMSDLQRVSWASVELVELYFHNQGQGFSAWRECHTHAHTHAPHTRMHHTHMHHTSLDPNRHCAISASCSLFLPRLQFSSSPISYLPNLSQCSPVARTHIQTRTHSHSLSLTRTHTRSHVHTLSHTRTHTHTHTHSHTHAHARTTEQIVPWIDRQTHSTDTHTHTLSHTHTLLSHTRTLTLTHTLTLTRARQNKLFLGSTGKRTLFWFVYLLHTK